MIQYLRRRICEKTTWVGIGAVLAGAEAIETPWLRFAVIGVGIAATVLPTRVLKGKPNG